MRPLDYPRHYYRVTSSHCLVVTDYCTVITQCSTDTTGDTENSEMGHFPTSFKSTALAMASHPVSQHHHHCKYIYRCKYIYIYLYIFCLSDDGWDILADLIDGRKPTRKDRSMYTEGFAPGHSVKHFFNLETRMRISLIQSR